MNSYELSALEGKDLYCEQCGEYISLDEYIDNDGDEINSIDLATGNLGGFSDDAKVYPINATLYVKE